MQIGKITQVMGPVVDVHFDETPLPYIQTALQVDNHGKKVTERKEYRGNPLGVCK